VEPRVKIGDISAPRGHGPQKGNYSGLPTQQSDIATDKRRMLRGSLDARSITDCNRSFGERLITPRALATTISG
jgi:hypothetical protein